jgi:hypothetical protein
VPPHDSFDGDVAKGEPKLLGYSVRLRVARKDEAAWHPELGFTRDVGER